MANTVNYTLAYLNMLDQVYKKGAVTSILEANPLTLRFSSENSKTVYIKKISSQGMGTYSRSTGYVAGDTTVSWEAHTIAQDRGRKYNIDAVDEIEALTTMGEIMSEVQRVSINPEIDAYRFEKMCTLAGGLDVSADLTSGTIASAISTATKTLNDAEVPEMDRVLFVSNNVHELMKDSTDLTYRDVQNNTGVMDRKILMYDDMPLVRVPSARFYNNFDFYDGTTGGQEAGGFVSNAGAKALNFMIVSRQAVIAIMKHFAPKIVWDQYNTDFNGTVGAYRMIHDLFVPDNKVDGIYVHSVA